MSEDSITKAFSKLELPRGPRPKPYVYKAKPGRPFGTKMSQKQLNGLRKYAVPEGHVLNPFGRGGYLRNEADDSELVGIGYRMKEMKRNRAKIKIKRALALEAHELQQLARENATAAMQTLIEIAKNKRAPEATRIAASSVILDRGYGKASQTSITANITNGKAGDLTPDELDKRINRALHRVEELTTRKTEARAGQKRPADIRQLN